MPELKNRHKERFAQEITSDPGMTQTQAYINAGYAAKWAGKHASTVYNDPEVQLRIHELQSQVVERFDVTRELVTEQFVNIAEASVLDLYDEFGEEIDIKRLPRRVAETIKEIQLHPKTRAIMKVVFHDKMAALREIAKLKNMYEDHQKAGAADFTIVMSEKDADL